MSFLNDLGTIGGQLGNAFTGFYNDIVKPGVDFAKNSVGKLFDYVDKPTSAFADVVKSTVGSDDVVSSLNNALTGNLDFERSLELQDKANEWSASEAQKSRDWQEYMSNTAYSRSVADLKSVGINPYAVLSGLKAASTPSGAQGSAYSSTWNSQASQAHLVSQILSIAVNGLSSAISIAGSL